MAAWSLEPDLPARRKEKNEKKKFHGKTRTAPVASRSRAVKKGSYKKSVLLPFAIKYNSNWICVRARCARKLLGYFAACSKMLPPESNYYDM